MLRYENQWSFLSTLMNITEQSMLFYQNCLEYNSMQNQLFSLHTNENKWTIYEFLFKIMKIYRNPSFWYENQWDFYQH